MHATKVMMKKATGTEILPYSMKHRDAGEHQKSKWTESGRKKKQD